MSEKITWTHVDKRVREICEERGILPIGDSDAEVAHSLIKFLNGRLRSVENSLTICQDSYARACDSLQQEITKGVSSGKTKKRLAALEAKVEELVAWTGLER